ncbi:MAG: hypothetical protein Ct9H300mP13_6240 [Gammaproteobacteria bacterium]|nr:MAG: hypothetical protein Ct9H300mP13_6240 [Gammaproteobacteria bacterium]
MGPEYNFTFINTTTMTIDATQTTLPALDVLEAEYEVIPCDPELADTHEFWLTTATPYHIQPM